MCNWKAMTGILIILKLLLRGANFFSRLPNPTATEKRGQLLPLFDLIWLSI